MVSEAFSGLAPLTEFLWRSRIAEPRATPSTSPDKSYAKLLTDSFLAMNGFLWRRPEMLKSPVSNLASPLQSIPPAAEYLRTSGSTFHPPAKIQKNPQTLSSPCCSRARTAHSPVSSCPFARPLRLLYSLYPCLVQGRVPKDLIPENDGLQKLSRKSPQIFILSVMLRNGIQTPSEEQPEPICLKKRFFLTDSFQDELCASSGTAL